MTAYHEDLPWSKNKNGSNIKKAQKGNKMFQM